MKTPVEVYLKTAYHPDCEYVNGEVIERDFGDYAQSRLQIPVAGYLFGLEHQLGAEVLIEVSMRIAATRYRAGCFRLQESPSEPVLTTPPLICVEDLMVQLLGRAADYLAPSQGQCTRNRRVSRRTASGRFVSRLG